MENGQTALHSLATLNLQTTEEAAEWTNAALSKTEDSSHDFFCSPYPEDGMFKSDFLPGQRSGRVPPSHGNVLNMLRIRGKQKSQIKSH